MKKYFAPNNFVLLSSFASGKVDKIIWDFYLSGNQFELSLPETLPKPIVVIGQMLFFGKQYK